MFTRVNVIICFTAQFTCVIYFSPNTVLLDILLLVTTTLPWILVVDVISKHLIWTLHVYTFKFFFVLSIKHIMKNIFNAELKKKVSIGLLCIRCYIILCEFIWVTKISYSSWMIFKKRITTSIFFVVKNENEQCFPFL